MPANTATVPAPRPANRAVQGFLHPVSWLFAHPGYFGGFRAMTHDPVLLEETLALLDPRSGGRYLDATFGGGGHARALLEAAPNAVLHALDRDPEAGRRAGDLREAFGSGFAFFSGNFDILDDLLPPGEYDGILFDLGVSSFQLDDAARGFSFREGGPLDMRMNPEEGATAAEWLRTATREELVEAVRDFGEEREWRRVVEGIVRARTEGELETTADLVRVVEGAKTRPPRKRPPSLHPATLTFQGIRIAINDELGAVRRGLPAAFKRLAPGGVLVAISFHSLEDRLVKRYFRRLCGEPEHAADSLPKQLRTREAEALTRRPVIPSDREIARNPRSRSSKLRAVRKLKPDEEY